MDLLHLQDTIKTNDLNAKLHLFLVVATCGTTDTGTVDPSTQNRRHCQRMWMHVDGAYDASTAFCKTHRSLVDGLGRADSIAWDAHKWLFQTNGCDAILFRDRSHPLKSFVATAGYVQDIEDEQHQRQQQEQQKQKQKQKQQPSCEIHGTTASN